MVGKWCGGDAGVGEATAVAWLWCGALRWREWELWCGPRLLTRPRLCLLARPPGLHPCTAAGYQADMRYKETVQYLKPLFSRLKNRVLGAWAGMWLGWWPAQSCGRLPEPVNAAPPPRMPLPPCPTLTPPLLPPPPLHAPATTAAADPTLLAGLTMIVDHCKERNYLAAYEIYMGVSIGNAAWPIGVTQVGLHERSAREKIRLGASSAVVRPRCRCCRCRCYDAAVLAAGSPARLPACPLSPSSRAHSPPPPLTGAHHERRGHP